MARQEFLVTIEMPPMATFTEAAKYIKDAVKVHCDNIPIKDPMFVLNRLKVKARPFYRRNADND